MIRSIRISIICSKRRASVYGLLIALLCAAPVLSQQLPRFSQYSSNEFIFNPSVAGYDGRTVFNLSARKQWMGFADYTPSSYLISLQGRILKSGYSLKSGDRGKPSFKRANKGRVGLGGIIYHDVNGAVERTGGQFSYAYHIFIDNSQLSLGLSGSIYQYRINKDRAAFKDPDNDPLNALIGKSTMVPDASFGVNYMTEKYHIGFAVNQIFQSKLKIGNSSDFKESEETRLLRHYYLIGDYRFNSTASAKWEWEPSFLILLNERLDKQAEISLKGYYKRQYWFGLSGRTCGDVVVMAGLKLHKYYFGYSYDYGFNGIARYTYGTHEICISAKFGDTARRYRWLDRY